MPPVCVVPSIHVGIARGMVKFQAETLLNSRSSVRDCNERRDRSGCLSSTAISRYCVKQSPSGSCNPPADRQVPVLPSAERIPARLVRPVLWRFAAIRRHARVTNRQRLTLNPTGTIRLLCETASATRISPPLSGSLVVQASPLKMLSPPLAGTAFMPWSSTSKKGEIPASELTDLS